MTKRVDDFDIRQTIIYQKLNDIQISNLTFSFTSYLFHTKPMFIYDLSLLTVGLVNVNVWG